MLGSLDTYLRFQADALNLRAYRQQLLASNIANGDTPNYKAVDIDFGAALQGTMHSRSGLALAATSARHMDPRAAAAHPAALYRIPHQASLDGNTVEMDTELAQFSDNAIRYQADLTFMNARIRSLLSAIQGQ